MNNILRCLQITRYLQLTSLNPQNLSPIFQICNILHVLRYFILSYIVGYCNFRFPAFKEHDSVFNCDICLFTFSNISWYDQIFPRCLYYVITPSATRLNVRSTATAHAESEGKTTRKKDLMPRQQRDFAKQKYYGQAHGNFLLPVESYVSEKGSLFSRLRRYGKLGVWGNARAVNAYYSFSF